MSPPLILVGIIIVVAIVAAFFIDFIHSIEVIFTILGGLGGLILALNFLQANFFKKRYAKKQIRKLVPATTIDFFYEILGSPTFINSTGEIKQNVFVRNLFYVTAVADVSKKVLAYSVTTRKKDFNPSLSLGPYFQGEKEILIKLGRSTFSELGNHFERKIVGGLGNRRAFYLEEYYFGNPGFYQTYLFSMNDAGYMSSENPVIFNVGVVDIPNSQIKEFMENTIINTYTITAPCINTDNLGEIGLNSWVGPDLDQVRMVNK